MAEDKLKEIISQVADQEKSEKKKAEDSIQLLVFDLDKEEYGLNITDLQEIIRIPEVTPVPNSPEFIKGILNLRGQIVVVVDLEKRFSLEREKQIEQKHIVIAEVEENSFGILVDEVKEVVRVPVSKIQSTPDLFTKRAHSDYFDGVVVLGEEEEKENSRLIVLLNVKKLLQEKELLELGKEISKAAPKTKPQEKIPEKFEKSVDK